MIENAAHYPTLPASRSLGTTGGRSRRAFAISGTVSEQEDGKKECTDRDGGGGKKKRPPFLGNERLCPRRLATNAFMSHCFVMLFCECETQDNAHF